MSSEVIDIEQMRLELLLVQHYHRADRDTLACLDVFSLIKLHDIFVKEIPNEVTVGINTYKRIPTTDE